MSEKNPEASAQAASRAAQADAAAAPVRPRLPNFVSFVMAVALVWLGGQFVRQGVSDELLSSNPELSVLWMGDSSDAIAQLARFRLETRDASGGARLAVKALQLEPLNAPALTTYGLAEDALRKTSTASDAMTLAGRLGWRDLPTQLWLFRRDLLAFDFDDAFNHADALMRRVPSPPPPMLNVLAAVGRDPRAIDPLASHLAANPSWRLPFFTFMGVMKPPATDVAGPLLTRLAAGPSKPTDEELGFYLATLAGQGRYQEAEQAWRRLTVGGASQGLLHDGDFERPARSTPFDWWLTGAVGWVASISDSPDASHGKALRIDYDGISKPAPVRQLIVLSPGAYRLTGRMLDEAGGAAGFSWRVVCPKGQAPLAVARPPPGPAGQWRTFSADFTVPSADCPAQLLDLTVEEGDMQNQITVWYDDLAISPATAVAPKTQAPAVGASGARQSP